MGKNTIFILFSTLLILCACSPPPPEVTETTSNAIDISEDPLQESTEAQAFNLKRGSYNFTVTPRAEYEVNAQVVGNRTYNDGWKGLLSPIDFAFAWGKLPEKPASDYMSYSQSNRWYYYTYKAGFPHPKSFIIQHSSNHHILPASENVKRAALSVKIGERIRCKGWLVSINGNKGDYKVWWNSSMSRNDEGNNSCEVLWVTEMQIGNNVYR